MTARPAARKKLCLQRLARLSAYLDRELPPAVRDQIRRHMSRCNDCRVVLRTLRKTIALCRQAPAADPPRATVKRVLTVVKREIARCRPAAS